MIPGFCLVFLCPYSGNIVSPFRQRQCCGLSEDKQNRDSSDHITALRLSFPWTLGHSSLRLIFWSDSFGTFQQQFHLIPVTYSRRETLYLDIFPDVQLNCRFPISQWNSSELSVFSASQFLHCTIMTKC